MLRIRVLIALVALVGACAALGAPTKKWTGVDKTEEQKWVVKDLVRFFYNYHPGQVQRVLVRQFDTQIAVKALNIFISVSVEESTPNRFGVLQKQAMGTCTQQTFNLTRPLLLVNAKKALPPYRYQSVSSTLVATWSALSPACDHPPSSSVPQPESAAGWTSVLPTAAVAQSLASFAFNHSYGPSMIATSARRYSLEGVQSARSEALAGGTLFELQVGIVSTPICKNMALCRFAPLHQSNLFFVFKGADKSLSLVSSGINATVTPATSAWAPVNLQGPGGSSSSVVVENLLSWAVNPSHLLGVSHCPRALSASVQAVSSCSTTNPLLGCRLYQITAEVTTKPVVRFPGKGSCSVSTFAILETDDGTSFDAPTDKLVVKRKNYPYRLVAQTKSPQQCTSPWPCDSTVTDPRPVPVTDPIDPVRHPIDPIPILDPVPQNPPNTTSLCAGPIRMMCMMGKSAQCVNGQWTCLAGKAASPTMAPSPFTGPPLPANLVPLQPWAVVNASSRVIDGICAFAASAMNPPPPAGNDAMGMITTITGVHSVRVEPAGSGALYELVVGVEKRPLCKPGAMCPMFIMCAQSHALVWESPSKALSLVESHEVTGGGCGGFGDGRPMAMNAASNASLASNWASTSAGAGTGVAKVAAWVLGASTSVNITSAAVQAVAGFGSLYQITLPVSVAGSCSLRQMLISNGTAPAVIDNVVVGSC